MAEKLREADEGEGDEGGEAEFVRTILLTLRSFASWAGEGGGELAA